MALSSPDVGVAIGATDASIAAAVCTNQASVAGQHTCCTTCKQGHLMTQTWLCQHATKLLSVVSMQCSCFFVQHATQLLFYAGTEHAGLG